MGGETGMRLQRWALRLAVWKGIVVDAQALEVRRDGRRSVWQVVDLIDSSFLAMRAVAVVGLGVVGQPLRVRRKMRLRMRLKGHFRSEVESSIIQSQEIGLLVDASPGDAPLRWR
jgi:hypothetical protein